MSKPKNDGPSRTRELLIRFSKFYNDLDAHNDYLYDTQLLPDPKQHIIHALYVGFDESENEVLDISETYAFLTNETVGDIMQPAFFNIISGPPAEFEYNQSLLQAFIYQTRK